MVPVIFSFDFKGQGKRSKVTALEYMGPLIMSLFLVVFFCEKKSQTGKN